MRAIAFAACLVLLVPLTAAHSTIAFEPYTGPPWTQTTTLTAPCETEFRGAGIGWVPMGVHATPGAIGSLAVRQGAAWERLRDDDPATPGLCGAVTPWMDFIAQEETISDTFGGFSAPAATNVLLSWHAAGVAMSLGPGVGATGSCTLTWSIPPLPAVTATAGVDPTTATCQFTLPVAPAPLATIWKLDGYAEADLTPLYPASPGYMNYVKAYVTVSDAAHNDEIEHCVEVTPWSPC